LTAAENHPLATHTPATITPRVRSVQPAALRFLPVLFTFTLSGFFATGGVYLNGKRQRQVL